MMQESNAPLGDSLANTPDASKLLTDQKQKFLVEAAVLLHKFGTPSHRLERVMTKVAKTLGEHGVFLYTPTALIVSLRQGEQEQTYMRRVDSGAVDVDKLIRFDEVLDDVESGAINLTEASARMETISKSAPLYNWIVTALACAIACAAVAVFFRGNLIEVILSLIIGLVVALLETLHGRWNGERGMLEPVAGFAAAMLSLLVSYWIIPHDHRLVTLASLIILLPGLGLTVALTELAVGHLSAGVARLAGACVTLLTLTIGVGIAWRIGRPLNNIPDIREYILPEWCQWIAMSIAPITFAILFRARPAQWPVIAGVSIAGFLVSRFSGTSFGIEVGSFLGAFAVGCGSNLYARIRDRPAMVPLTPGIIMLVPGSFGYRSLTALLDRQTLQGIDLAFSMLMLGATVVGGVLMSNALLPPKRIL